MNRQESRYVERVAKERGGTIQKRRRFQVSKLKKWKPQVPGEIKTRKLRGTGRIVIIRGNEMADE